MELLGKYGKEDLAILYVAKQDDKVVEFVESLQPPIPREEKWVLIISTMYGCPIGCLMCDAGEYYHGKVSKEGMLEEIDYMIHSRFPERKISIPKLKIQFARMGEPTLNENVLAALRELPKLYDAPGLMPCISTIAPKGSEDFLDELIEIKNKFYSNGRFQLQFSIHSTNEEERRKWMSSTIWNLERIAAFGEKWYVEGDRKITLNFAVAEDSEIDPDIILKHFNPEKYWIKLTPVNPTNRAIHNKLQSGITEENSEINPLVEEFKKRGFEASVSIGEWEENDIGSNCGQFATKYQNNEVVIRENYTTSDYDLSN
ncbi:MAG: radical SAM protein [Candidatus Heimdallarchaeota archaeon]|nr:radical SAM protein [Candidatus Heimdallarchaeota archaeon]MCK4770977.1 radical SAM protein [Candidatus Heimdallarchaeota archaeon]